MEFDSEIRAYNKNVADLSIFRKQICPGYLFEWDGKSDCILSYWGTTELLADLNEAIKIRHLTIIDPSFENFIEVEHKATIKEIEYFESSREPSENKMQRVIVEEKDDYSERVETKASQMKERNEARKVELERVIAQNEVKLAELLEKERTENELKRKEKLETYNAISLQVDLPEFNDDKYAAVQLDKSLPEVKQTVDEDDTFMLVDRTITHLESLLFDYKPKMTFIESLETDVTVVMKKRLINYLSCRIAELSSQRIAPGDIRQLRSDEFFNINNKKQKEKIDNYYLLAKKYFARQRKMFGEALVNPYQISGFTLLEKQLEDKYFLSNKESFQFYTEIFKNIRTVSSSSSCHLANFNFRGGSIDRITKQFSILLKS